jgi:hypothetical protein
MGVGKKEGRAAPSIDAERTSAESATLKAFVVSNQ